MRAKLPFVGLLIAFIVPAYADTYVSMTLTGLGPNGVSVFDTSNVWGGEPISPYEAQTGTLKFLVSCLDVDVNTNVGVAYTYDITTPATNDPTPYSDYQAAAILEQEMLSASSEDMRGELSFAIWLIFNPGAPEFNNSQVQDPTTLSAITNFANTALANAGTKGFDIPNFIVYYPVSSTSSGGVTPPPTSQRYIRLVPDVGTTFMLLSGALIGIETLRRRAGREALHLGRNQEMA